VFGRKEPSLKEGAYVFATRPDGEFRTVIFGIVSGVEGSRVGVTGTSVNPVGLRNKVEQGKAGPRSAEILRNPTPDNFVFALIYRIEHDDFAGEFDLESERLLVIPPRVHAVLDGWVRESIPDVLNGVLSLPSGEERDKAKRVLRQRMDTLSDKNLRRTLYSVARSLKVLN